MRKDIVGLGKDSLIYGFGSVLLRFIGLITLPLFTSYLSPDEYGVLSMFAILTMIAYPIFSLGLGTSMGPLYFKENTLDCKSVTVWSTFLISLVSATFLLIIAWVIPEKLSSLIGIYSTYSRLTSLSLSGTALTILSISFLQHIQFEKQAKTYVFITIITSLSTLFFNLYSVIILDWGISGMVYGPIVGNLFMFISLLYIVSKNTNLKIDFKLVRELLKQGIPIIPGFFFLFILMHGNKYLLQIFYGLDALGVYSIGFNIGMAINIVTSSISTAWFPFAMSFQNNKNDTGPVFGKIITYYTIGVGFLVLCFFIFAKPVIMIISNEIYFNAFLSIGLIAAANYFAGMYILFLPGMYFNKEIFIQVLIQAIAVLITSPFAYLLVKYNSIFGAACGVALGNFNLAFFTYLWNMYRKDLYIKIYFDYKRIFIFFILFIFISVISFQINFNTFFENIISSLILWIFSFILIIQFFTKAELKRIPLLIRFKF
jgi:O-antigen/teichoic acid export membrane protein